MGRFCKYRLGVDCTNLFAVQHLPHCPFLLASLRLLEEPDEAGVVATTTGVIEESAVAVAAAGVEEAATVDAATTTAKEEDTGAVTMERTAVSAEEGAAAEGAVEAVGAAVKTGKMEKGVDIEAVGAMTTKVAREVSEAAAETKMARTVVKRMARVS